MSTEETVSPVAETQNPAPEVAEVAPEVAEPEKVEAEASAEEPAGEPEEDQALKRMQRRIDKQTAKFYREQARAEQLAQEVAELKARAGTEAPGEKGSDPVTMAREIARVERFTEKANSIYAEGTKAHTDYADALKSLASEVGNFVEPNGAPSRFMDVVLEVANSPTELLYHLGKNPELAEELADLSPIKLATRLDRIEREITEKSKPKPSSAPKPLDAVKPRSSGSKDPKDMTDREFAEWRHSQIKARGNF